MDYGQGSHGSGRKGSVVGDQYDQQARQPRDGGMPPERPPTNEEVAKAVQQKVAVSGGCLDGVMRGGWRAGGCGLRHVHTCTGRPVRGAWPPGVLRGEVVYHWEFKKVPLVADVLVPACRCLAGCGAASAAP